MLKHWNEWMTRITLGANETGRIVRMTAGDYKIRGKSLKIQYQRHWNEWMTRITS